MSKKQARINAAVRGVFVEVLDEYNWRCTGCGSPNSLTPSHIIRRSKRPDLITERRNIKPHCVRCHNMWDTGNIGVMRVLRDFDQNMAYIKEVDIQYYNRLNEEQ